MKCPLAILILLKKCIVFLILLFSSISLQWSLRKAFLSILAIVWNSAFRWIYLSFYPLPFTSLLFSAIFKASSDNHFAFLPFFSKRMVLIPVSCTMSQTSVHSSSGTLSIRSSPLNLFLTSFFKFLLLLLGRYHFCPLLCPSLHEIFSWYLFSWRDL